MNFHVIIWSVAYCLDYLFVIYNFLHYNTLTCKILLCINRAKYIAYTIAHIYVIYVKYYKLSISKLLKIAPNLFLIFNDFREKLIIKTNLNFLVPKKFYFYLLILKIIACNTTHIYNTCTYTQSCYAFAIWYCFVFQRISKNPTT